MNEGRLEGVSIERPCSKRWSELVGDERRRFCSECSLHVTNLSAMTRSEADGFLAASQGRVCVTYVPDAKGAVALRSTARTRRGLARHLATAASFLVGLLVLLPGCRPAADAPDTNTPDPDDTRPDDGRLMGKVSADPVCKVDDDDRMIMGEMALPDPPQSAPTPETTPAHE